MTTSTHERLAYQRLASARLLANADRAIEAAVLTAIEAWLDATRVAILRELRNVMPGLTAAGYHNTGPALDAATNAYNEWQGQLKGTVLPQISAAFGEAYNQIRQSAEFSSYRWQQEYIDQVSDRLRIWPDGAFEELRPELANMLANADSYEDMTNHIGAILGIDAPTRALRAAIGDVDAQIADNPGPARLDALRRRRADLWRQHDDSLGEWQWKARRIARTEAHGAVVGGKLAAATVRANHLGVALYKGWLSTDDERVRVTHRVADGQIVRIGESFRVGGFLIPYPAAPITVAPHETIQCRCDVCIMDYDEVQDMLQGPDGSSGVIRPGGQRVGPDDPDAADAAIAELAEKMRRPTPKPRRGEDEGQQLPTPDDTPLEVDPEHKPDTPHPDFTQFSDDELIQWMDDANKSGDTDLFDAVAVEIDARMAEHERRQGEDDLVDPDHTGDDLDTSESSSEPETPQVERTPRDDLTDAIDQAYVDLDRAFPDDNTVPAAMTGWARIQVAEQALREYDAIGEPVEVTPSLQAARDVLRVQQLVDGTDRPNAVFLAQLYQDQTRLQTELIRDSVIDVEPTPELPLPGVSRIATPPDNRDAIRASNPEYLTNEAWRINCQRAVQAHELRMRGYDVVAQPNNDRRDPAFNWLEVNRAHWEGEPNAPEIVEHYRDYWPDLDATTGDGWTDSGPFFETMTALKRQMLAELPDGGRAWVSTAWKRRGAGGHIFVARREGNKIIFDDPQPGTFDVGSDYGKRGRLFQFRRVDHLTPQDIVLGEVVADIARPDTPNPMRPLLPPLSVPAMRQAIIAAQQRRAERRNKP